MSHPMPPGGLAGIVLAGGRASRFGRDKLLEPLDGLPLLHHATLALGPIVDELLVVVRPHGAPPALPARDRIGAPVRVIRDPEPYGGPLVALAAALETVRHERALLVAGDMPALHPGVLLEMVATLDSSGADVVILGAQGRVQSIPAVLRVQPARQSARRALESGSRALRALYDHLIVATLPEADWRALDPAGGTLRDVDTPADLQWPDEPGQPPGSRSNG